MCVSSGTLEINGTNSGDSLATISRAEAATKHRFFTVTGGAKVILRKWNLTGGENSARSGYNSYGGALYLTGSGTSLDVYDSVMCHNNGNGAAIFTKTGPNVHVHVERSTFYGNSKSAITIRGGGDSLTTVDSVFYENSNTHGGAVHCNEDGGVAAICIFKNTSLWDL